jgi:enoyl-[acyl-carrier protein] reductase/trans-2-enoyl-CoA reductase (NAD+)
MVVYSLASPRRTHPTTGVVYNSVLKPIGNPYNSKTVDFHTAEVSDVTLEQAGEDEIKDTVTVMGGEDWLMWIEALKNANVLSDGVTTVAYSYIGPELTHPIYRDGTIGRAKNHLESSVTNINDVLNSLGGKSYVSINKALVTQASSAIPVVPLYISLLYKIMKEKGNHEGCIEQMYRMFSDRLYNGSNKIDVDSAGRIRMDDYEMEESVQKEIRKLWPQLNSENVLSISDLAGFRKEFFKLFGFERDDVDYEAEVEV